ncbi:HlyD family secretion protein [Bordetella ansorpii]|uniref:Membrane fusion protein (MFP) family protein n=2 Tax=Bordetella ansorpii TaxID=288768 RepID=A0A157SNF3_9BORD|nr:HlyD family secretion protein [Bordetella ansorpii]
MEMQTVPGHKPPPAPPGLPAAERKKSLLRRLWLLPRDLIVRVFDRILDGADKGKPEHKSDYVGNAEWVIHQSQARGSRILLWVSLVTVFLLLVWAALGYIDEVVRGEGKVVPSRQVQIIQSLDGGIVQEILVRPGQEVQAGQVLLKLDPTRFSSSLGENNAEYLSLLAKSARLQALATGDPFVMPERVAKEAHQIGEQERNAWQARNNEITATVNVARDQLKQRQDELRETIAKRDQAASSCALTSRELSVTKPLLSSGAVSEVELLRLQRDVARFCGDQKGAEAQIDRIQSSISEAQNKVQEAELTIRNTARSELSDTNTKLATLREGQSALADRVRLSEVRAPVNGTVKTLFNNTIGGVVQPGKDIIEIVPKDDTLLLEVKIQPRDIGFLHPQQEADVKFTAYDFSIYGGLKGKVEQIGADTVTDEKGNSFYIVRVRTDKNGVGDQQLPIIPGMVAEVHVLTGKHTVLQYLLKPILRARENAFTER